MLACQPYQLLPVGSQGDPSHPRFLDELDSTYLEVFSYDELADQPVEEEQALDYFERMKSMLGEG